MYIYILICLLFANWLLLRAVYQARFIQNKLIFPQVTYENRWDSNLDCMIREPTMFPLSYRAQWNRWVPLWVKQPKMKWNYKERSLSKLKMVLLIKEKNLTVFDAKSQVFSCKSFQNAKFMNVCSCKSIRKVKLARNLVQKIYIQKLCWV